MLFYGLISLLFTLLGLIIGIPVIGEFIRTGMVPRFPSAFLASSLVIIGILSLVVGLILNGILKARQEAARLEYLRWAPPMWLPKA